MLRRFGPLALTIGSMLSAAAATAQAPLGMPSGDSPVTGADASSAGGEALSPSLLRDAAHFNPYTLYDERRAAFQKTSGEECERPSARYAYGNCGPTSKRNDDPGSWQAANAWPWLNLEKKFFMSYNYHGPQRTATGDAFGESHGASVGVEWLPWVSTDAERRFSRWGFITAFDYQSYQGNPNVVILSALTGNTLSSAGGDGYSIIVAPVHRTDLIVFGKRISPSIAAGAIFDWVSMKQQPAPAQPNVFPTAVDTLIPRKNPQGTQAQFTSPGNFQTRTVDEFRFTDFSVGFYGRFLLDIPVTQKLNFGVGIDGRYVPTRALVQKNDVKKQLGLILQLSYDF